MLDKIINDVCEWHKETFPDVDEESQIKKLEEELHEYYESYDFSELADVIICSLVLWKRFNSDIGKFVFNYAKNESSQIRLNFIVSDKLRINKKRIWKKINGVYRHVDGGAKDE